MTTQASITIGELEANYQLYCKALKMLIAEKRSLNKIQRTVCWGAWKPCTIACPSITNPRTISTRN